MFSDSLTAERVMARCNFVENAFRNFQPSTWCTVDENTVAVGTTNRLTFLITFPYQGQGFYVPPALLLNNLGLTQAELSEKTVMSKFHLTFFFFLQSRIVSNFRSQPEYTVKSIAAQKILGLSAYVLALCSDLKLRVWNVTKRSCMSVIDIPVVRADSFDCTKNLLSLFMPSSTQFRNFIYS